MTWPPACARHRRLGVHRRPDRGAARPRGDEQCAPCSATSPEACASRVHPVELARGDVTDLRAVGEAAAGCDVIIHCAFGTHGGAAERRAVTVDGAAKRAGGGGSGGRAASGAPEHRDGLRRALGPGPARDPPAACPGRRLRRREARGGGARVPVPPGAGPARVVIQPTAVYGPFGAAWTARVLKQLRSGTRAADRRGRGRLQRRLHRRRRRRGAPGDGA